MTSSDTQKPAVNWTKWVHDVPDYPQPGILFRDLTPLWADGHAWQSASRSLAEAIVKTLGAAPQYVLAVEARGFLVGQALANHWEAGVLLARKPGKLPRVAHSQKFELEYGESSLEIHDHAMEPGSTILIADDVLATGGTAEAAVRLASKLPGTLVGVAFLIEIAALAGRKRLEGIPLWSLISYQEDGSAEFLS